MEAMGDGDKQIWAIEFGWILHPGDSCRNEWDWPERWWQIVSEAEQATNLAGAYGYAYQNWPWMGVMNFFNLDFATVGWYDYCQPMRFYSLVYRDTPGQGSLNYRQAYYALRDMEKPTSGSLSGYLRDNRRIPIFGAKVEILGDGYTNTGGGGRYEFPFLTSGTYDLRATASGYDPLEPMRGVVVNEGEALTDLNFYLPPLDDLAQNGGFESDFGGWTASGDNLPVITDTVHTGYKAARLGGPASGDSWIEQGVAIPPGTYDPTLSFLYLYSSSDTGDQFRVEIRDAGGSLLDTPWSTASATSLWTHHWLDLSPYEGQTIRVRFLVSENGSNPSYLYLDEVSLGKASGGPYKGYLPLVHRGS
ncbi:MAG: carboxypeptidase regulatory-like domain-containing protein, partial [Anaerolineae bacterium]